jgi:hypothetical protein
MAGNQFCNGFVAQLSKQARTCSRMVRLVPEQIVQQGGSS